MLWSAIFYHSNTNVCHNLCQLRDEIINFFSVPCYKKPPEWSMMAPVAGWWPGLCVVPGPGSPPLISQLEPGLTTGSYLDTDTILQSGHSLTQCTSIQHWYSRLPTRWICSLWECFENALKKLWECSRVCELWAHLIWWTIPIYRW